MSAREEISILKTGCARAGVLTPLVALLFVAACTTAEVQPDPLEGSITRAADTARQRGERSATVQYSAQRDLHRITLDDVIRDQSLLTARGTEITETTALAHFIYRWQALADVRELSRRPAGALNADHCAFSIPDRVRRAGGTSLGLLGGTYRVRGVDVTQTVASPEATLRAGQSYLLIATLCESGGPAYLPLGADGVFAIQGGRVVVDPQRTDPLAKQLRGLEYLERIEHYITQGGGR